jgi:poly-gamma-glutamate synthesis protein (capsule biosynthesis protein)
MSKAPFDARIREIPSDLRDAMTGTSWHDDPRCPPFTALRVIEMSHWTFEGTIERGRLVVAAEIASDVAKAFERIFAARFPIAAMAPISTYGGSDAQSMAANNCSCFNFRCIAGREELSQHAFGLAIDVNPVQNPVITAAKLAPPAGEAYRDRSDVRSGMIVRPGPVVEAFESIGWGWGGDWDSKKDYHHFSRSHR